MWLVKIINIMHSYIVIIAATERQILEILKLYNVVHYFLILTSY